MKEDLASQIGGKNKRGKSITPFLFMRIIHRSRIFRAVTDSDVAGFEWPVFFFNVLLFCVRRC